MKTEPYINPIRGCKIFVTHRAHNLLKYATSVCLKKRSSNFPSAKHQILLFIFLYIILIVKNSIQLAEVAICFYFLYTPKRGIRGKQWEAERINGKQRKIQY